MVKIEKIMNTLMQYCAHPLFRAYLSCNESVLYIKNLTNPYLLANQTLYYYRRIALSLKKECDTPLLRTCQTGALRQASLSYRLSHNPLPVTSLLESLVDNSAASAVFWYVAQTIVRAAQILFASNVPLKRLYIFPPAH